MSYLLIGKDQSKKDAKIAELKKKYISSKEAQEFDYEVLYSHKLEPSVLKKALMTLPVVAKKRFILIHTCHKLTPQNKKLILEFFSSSQDQCFVVLDSAEMTASDSFAKKIKSAVKVVDFSSGKKTNVFDMTRAIGARRPAEALKFLSGLYQEGMHPLQIMGTLVWFWGSVKNRLSQQKFAQGLKALQEADLNVKRSRINPEYAIEVVVARLSMLLT